MQRVILIMISIQDILSSMLKGVQIPPITNILGSAFEVMLMYQQQIRAKPA